MPEVLNATQVGTNENETRTYVGRPSIWGNPFVLGRHGSRDEIIGKYAEYLENSSILMSRIGELTGKDLICWCAPESCHADLLLELANMRRSDG